MLNLMRFQPFGFVISKTPTTSSALASRTRRHGSPRMMLTTRNACKYSGYPRYFPANKSLLSPRDKFGGLLKLIQVLKPNGADIVAAAKPCKPMHWISLIILLDQLPRNCFRGAQARVAFTFFDSFALVVASHAIESGVPMEPEVRFRLAYRFWFYMPMEHCESLEVAEMSHKAHFDMFHDYERLLERDVEGWDGEFAQHRAVLLKRRSDFGKLKGIITSICDSKLDALRQFGRFPQRNEVLGRTSTAEELQFLDGK